MGKKKSNNQNNNKAAAAPAPVAVVEEVAPVEVVELAKEEPIPVDSTSSEMVADSATGESPAAESPVAAAEPSAEEAAAAPVAEEEAVEVVAAASSSTPVVAADAPYTIVPTPDEETAIERVTGFYRRRENNERTAAEAREEEDHKALVATLEGEALATATRSWSHKPCHLLLDVAFGNMEKFSRLYIEAEFEAFSFMVSTDAQNERVAILKAQRAFRSAVDGIVSEELTARSALRKEAREAFTSMIIAKDTERRALLAAEREARRQARMEATPAPLPAADDSEANYDSVTLKSEGGDEEPKEE